MRYLRNGAALIVALVLVLTFAACGRKENEDSLHARFSVLYETDVLNEILADPESHAIEIEAFGLDDFVATFSDAQAFRSYTVEISVQNTNNYAIELLNLQMDAKKQGANGVYFSALTENGQLGLPAHFTGDEALYYSVIAKSSMSMQEVLQALGEMDVACVFIEGNEAPDMDESIDPALLHTSVVLYEP